MRTILSLTLLVATGGAPTLPIRQALAPPAPKKAIIAYYAGDATGFRSYPTQQIKPLWPRWWP